MGSVKTDLFTAENIISPSWLAMSFLIVGCHAALKAERCFAFEAFRISIDKEGEKASGEVYLILSWWGSNANGDRLLLILVILFDKTLPGLYRSRLICTHLWMRICWVVFFGHGKVGGCGSLSAATTQHTSADGWSRQSTMRFTRIRCRSQLEQRDVSMGWGGMPGLGSCARAPWASFSSRVSRPLCLFVPRLRVWASRIYEIRGQVKGHSSQVKWEAKICETKEMTGQCQVKGQKSSERFRVDESEQPARRPDHTPKRVHTNVLGIKMRLKFHSLA